ncbi:MAG: hypothetical protein S4CHLAM37_14010 [Chlamydiia bacterium]|nr:hypothetical protein [Chlamydiia bacterium]
MKSQKDILFIPEQKTDKFYMSPLHVTFKQDLANLKRTLSKTDLDSFLTLHQKVESKPKECIKEIDALLKKYANVPEIYNLLSYAYIRIRKIKKAENLTKLAYEAIPDNLFVKINYADQCLRKKKTQEVEKIFEGHTDLKKLYPNRAAFHVSEFVGFMNVMGFYHLSVKKRDEAICYHYLSHKLDAKNTSTRLLGKKLYKISLLKKFISRFKPSIVE